MKPDAVIGSCNFTSDEVDTGGSWSLLVSRPNRIRDSRYSVKLKILSQKNTVENGRIKEDTNVGP